MIDFCQSICGKVEGGNAGAEQGFSDSLMVGDVLLVMQQAAGAGKEQPAEGCGRQPRDGTEQAVFDRIADKIKKPRTAAKPAIQVISF